MTNHADLPSEVEALSLADLAADAEVVRRALHVRDSAMARPTRRRIVLPDGAIPDRALALVAGLDVYGD